MELMTDEKTGFKRTDLGLIPEDWEVVLLKNYTTKIGSGITPRGGKKVYQEYGRPFVRSQNVGWGFLKLDDLAFIDNATHATFDSTEIQEDDVLLNITGASIGRSSIVKSNIIGGNVNQHVCIIRTLCAAIDPKFLNLILLSDIGQKQIDSYQAGGNREGLNFGQIGSFLIPLPPTLEEQQAIASALSDVDELIRSLDALIQKKEAIKKGTMQQLLTGKTRPALLGRKDKFEKTDIGFFPEDWKIVNLPEYCWFQEGPGLRKWQFTRKGMKVINVTNLQSSGILDLEKTDRHITLKEFQNNYRHFEIDEGDFVMASSGNSYCKTSVVRKIDLPLMMNTSVIRFKALDGIDTGYMEHYLRSRYFKDQIDLLITGGAQPNFGPYHLRRVFIPLPPTIKEQKAIAQILSDMDEELQALCRKREKMVGVKEGMMQELLTGKTRLV
jgi:type I restriction enzyme S subunit